MVRTNSTIQDMIDVGDTIVAYCHNARCNHRAAVDLCLIREKLGPDHGALHEDLVPKLRCSRCGGKRIGMIVTPAAKGPDSNAYRKAKIGR